MHRFRIDLLGSKTAAAGKALEAMGAIPFGREDPASWAWSSEAGWDAIADFSRSQESVPLGVQGFQDFDDEVALARVKGGEVRVISRQSVLPSHWGSFHDEDGQPLERDILAWAGSVIAADERRLEESTLFCGLETAMVVGGEAGRFVSVTRKFLSADEPTNESLDAVVRLARTSLRVSVASEPRSAGALRYLIPLRLTQSVVHAGRDDYIERPGQADWQWWLGLLLSSAAHLVGDAHECDLRSTAPEVSSSPDLHQLRAGEMMELSACGLVTSCVQTLALFGSERASGSGSPRYRSAER